MKSRMKEQQDKELKLPQIQNKTGEGFKQTQRKQRPQSQRKDRISDLEKRLFTKFDALEKEGLSDKLKVAESCREIQTGGEDKYIQKIGKLMPQLYSKLMDTRKVEPLREINKSMDYRIIGREKAVNEGQEGTAETEYFVTTYQSTSGKEIEKEDTAEFGLYEEEMERIYAQYLSSQRLAKETSSLQLRRINEELEKSEGQVIQLQKSFTGMLDRLQAVSRSDS